MEYKQDVKDENGKGKRLFVEYNKEDNMFKVRINLANIFFIIDDNRKEQNQHDVEDKCEG